MIVRFRCFSFETAALSLLSSIHVIFLRMVVIYPHGKKSPGGDHSIDGKRTLIGCKRNGVM
jgi:hypothetical protein